MFAGMEASCTWHPSPASRTAARNPTGPGPITKSGFLLQIRLPGQLGNGSGGGGIAAIGIEHKRNFKWAEKSPAGFRQQPLAYIDIRAADPDRQIFQVGNSAGKKGAQDQTTDIRQE